jgi:cation diffusion facilitator family transporter
MSGSRAVRLFVSVIIGLVVLKVAVGAVTGSLSVLAQTADSVIDLFAVVVSFITVKIAVKPADKDHPFGHGKVETIATATQALVIFLIGVIVVYFAIHRILNTTPLKLTEAGMAVMAFSILTSFLLSSFLLRNPRLAQSPFFKMNARNIAADIYSSTAVLAGLIIMVFTNWYILDPIIAILTTLWVFKLGIDMLRRSSPALIDERLPTNEEDIISSTILEHYSQLVGFHQLRTRRSGYQRYIDLHLVVPQNFSVAEAHGITEHLEQDIRRKLPHTSMIVHIEPCERNCGECSFPCQLREKTQ